MTDNRSLYWPNTTAKTNRLERCWSTIVGMINQVMVKRHTCTRVKLCSSLVSTVGGEGRGAGGGMGKDRGRRMLGLGKSTT